MKTNTRIKVCFIGEIYQHKVRIFTEQIIPHCTLNQGVANYSATSVTMKWVYSLILLLVLGIELSAQGLLNQGAEFQRPFCDTIPFTFVQGKMLISVEIDQKPRLFMLDTGAPTMIFESLKNEIDAKYLDNQEVRDAVGGIDALDVVELKSFKIGRIEFRDVPAMQVYDDLVGMLKCWGVVGMIGSNALRNCILQIEWKARRLILSNELKNLNLSQASATLLHLDEEQSQPFLELSLGNGELIAANFDTGDESAFCISKEDAAFTLSNRMARVKNIGHGKRTMSLTESQQDQWFEELIFDSLSIGKSHFLKFSSVADEEQSFSRVGIGLGQYGIITLDYLNGQFYFQPYENKVQIPIEQKSLGFAIYPTETHYEIGMVWQNSPAGRLGLKSGCKILKIEEEDFSKRTPELDCELIMRRFAQKEILRLKYMDENGEIAEVKIEGE
jgi:hypothetical protein